MEASSLGLTTTHLCLYPFPEQERITPLNTRFIWLVNQWGHLNCVAKYLKYTLSL